MPGFQETQLRPGAHHFFLQQIRGFFQAFLKSFPGDIQTLLSLLHGGLRHMNPLPGGGEIPLGGSDLIARLMHGLLVLKFHLA